MGRPENVHRTHISRFRDMFFFQVGRLGMPLASSIFCRFFKTIHDPLSEIPCPLGPNVNSWAVLGAAREPTFPFNVTCVGTMGRLGMPLAFPIFLLIF